MMKLVLVLIIISLYSVKSLKYINVNRVNKDQNVITKLELNVLDQDTTSILLQDNTNAFIDGFERSFAGTMFSRVLGGIVGNIVAGVALTTITVALSKTVWNKDNKSNNNDNKFSTNNIENDNDNKLKTKSIPIEAWGKLIICIAIDFLGDASYVIPGVGELEDIAWAPLSAFLLSKLFNNNVLTSFEFIKEVLPGTDIIPVATISWLLQYVFSDTFISNSLQLSNKKDDKK